MSDGTVQPAILPFKSEYAAENPVSASSQASDSLLHVDQPHPETSVPPPEPRSPLGQLLISCLRREYPSILRSLEDIHGSISSIDVEKVKELEQLLQKLCDVMKGKGLWYPQDGFLRCGHDISDLHSPTPAVLGELLFVLIANQVFLMRGESPVCLVCGRLKVHGKNNPKVGDPGCHIFAECLLRAYMIIHGLPDTFFIWDCMREELVNIGLRKPPVAYQLACQECEGKAAQSELPLRNLYSFICKNKHKDINVHHSEVWGYVYIVATMLLRGFLVNIDILEQIYLSAECEELLRSYFQLINYIRSNTQPLPEIHQPLPEIHQFLIPHEPDSASHLLNIQLRALHYTHVVNEKGGLFLLMHFDILYWVMPLNETGTHMLKSENGIRLQPDESIVLLRTSDRKFPRFLHHHIQTLAFELEAYRSKFPPDYHMDSVRMFVRHLRARFPHVSINISCEGKQQIHVPATSVDPIPFTRALAYARHTHEDENWFKVEPEREPGLLQPGGVSGDALLERCRELKRQKEGLQGEIQKTRSSTKRQIEATTKHIIKEIERIRSTMREFEARFCALEEKVCSLQTDLDERVSELDQRIGTAEKQVAELKKFSIVAWSKQR